MLAIVRFPAWHNYKKFTRGSGPQPTGQGLLCAGMMIGEVIKKNERRIASDKMTQEDARSRFIHF